MYIFVRTQVLMALGFAAAHWAVGGNAADSPLAFGAVSIATAVALNEILPLWPLSEEYTR